ncbi:universal stress protein [Mucilaginibacter litoreus]|uniref:Universal stress protein n=1 Tax=Mucilaginibacter litoreus TaxID=1048221 RepID=A0ABW3AYI5_9SPHI
MKTILVPTDFSPAATNAARYALQVAKRIHAGIKLCNAIQVPAETVFSAQIAWPLEDLDSLKEASETELTYLEDSLSADGNTGTGYHPAIAHSTGIGSATDLVRNLVSDDKASLVIMGMSGANLFSKLIVGSTTKALIDKADFPLLLVPKDYSYKPVKKIAFATNFDDGDIDRLQMLASLARHFNAEILLTHVVDLPGKDKEQINAFLNKVTNKIDYPRIYYRGLQSEAVKKGLKWLTDNGQLDILAITHLKHGLFSPSITQRLAEHTKVPLLVFPEGFKPCVF